VTATRVIEEALAAARAIGNLFYVFLALIHMVIIACLQNDSTKAKGYCFELLALGRETGASLIAWFALLAFGVVAIFGGEPQRGVQLIAAPEGVFRQHGVNLPEGADPTMLIFRQALERARVQLGPAAFEAARQEGRMRTLEQAIALATEDESKDAPPPEA
jgi:hypothetical protein